MPQATATSIAQRIVALRRHGWTGIHIDVAVGVSPATLTRACPGIDAVAAADRSTEPGADAARSTDVGTSAGVDTAATTNRSTGPH